MTNYNNYFTHHKINITENNQAKEDYLDEVEDSIRETTELLGSLLYDLKATIYNKADACGFENSPPNYWKGRVTSSFDNRASDALAIISGLRSNLVDELDAKIHEWDKQTFVDKLAKETA